MNSESLSYRTAPGFPRPFTETYFPKTTIQRGLNQEGTHIPQKLLLPAFSQMTESRSRAKDQGRTLGKWVLLLPCEHTE